MKGSVPLVAVLCLLSGAPLFGSPPQSHPLTLAEALALMRAQNPLLASGRAHVEGVQANEITAGLRPNPVLNSANEDFNVFDPSKFDIAHTQEFTVNVSQLFERGGKRQRRVESAQLDTLVTRRAFRDAERQLELQVRLSFVGMLLAKSNLELAKANLSDFREAVRLNGIRAKAGEISPTEFDRISLQQAGVENDVLTAELALAQSRVQLQQLLGIIDYRQEFDIAGSLGPIDVSLSLPEMERLALANRPDYLAALDSVKKAQADVALAEANGATDFTFGGEYKRNGPDNTLGFTLQIPLRFFDRNQGEKARTRRELDASRASEQAARSQVLADVAQAWDSYRLALQRARLYSEDYLRRARQVRDRVEFSYRQRASTLLEYQDAVRAYRDTELAWRSANAQALSALHQLSFVTGTELMP